MIAIFLKRQLKLNQNNQNKIKAYQVLPDLPNELSLLYRGSLSSCNYDCDYCPFAKTYNNKAELAKDAKEVARFVAWISNQTYPISVLFTPWGEGLVRKHYQQAMITLSHLPHVRRVAIQTNLCIGLDWLKQVNTEKIALWCTFHPSQVNMDTFVRRCMALKQRRIRFSVGMVALKQDMANIKQLRQRLSKDIPMWLNAYDKRHKISSEGDYYSFDDISMLGKIDPFFPYNLNPKPSLEAPCVTGETVLSVNGVGDVQRCHFIKERLGNLYDGSFYQHLKPRQCTNQTCDCFIGYVHRPDLTVHQAYQGGRLERVLANSANC